MLGFILNLSLISWKRIQMRLKNTQGTNFIKLLKLQKLKTLDSELAGNQMGRKQYPNERTIIEEATL